MQTSIIQTVADIPLQPSKVAQDEAIKMAAHELLVDLRHKLAHMLMLLVFKIGLPINVFINLLSAYQTFVLHQYPPLLYIVGICAVVLTYSPAWWLVKQQRPVTAMIAFVLVSEGVLLLQIPLINRVEVFTFATLPLMLPPFIFNRRTVFGFLIVLTGLYIGIAISSPTMHSDLWASNMINSIIFVWAITGTFTVLGHAMRRFLEDFARMVVLREAEAVERARLEEHTRVLQEHHNRLMYAQHDLRGPCNTMLGAIDVLQTPNLSPSITQRLLKQIEPVVLQLRSRLDSLFDEAKAPLLETRHDLPLLDLGCVVAGHQAELQRLTAVATAEERPTPPTVSVHVSPGTPRLIQARKGEIHRILENLVFNSIAAGADSIDITVREGENRSVELVVEDTGKGFPRWLLEQPLRPTYSQTEKGSGLGLAGVVANVRAFHGTIALENTPGACVRMRFPLADEKKAGRE